MSGDVQPRKRKEKRKKKEGGSLGTIHDQASFQKFSRDFDEKKHFELPPDQGEKIHVQNEHGMGGNICVKIIFFCLLGLLVGAIGLIYQQYQGSTDVDLPSVEESRFAEYFTGWLDDSTDDHEHETIENAAQEESSEHDEHNEMEEQEKGGEEEEEEEEYNEADDDRDEPEDQNREEQDEPGLFSRILGIQKDSENHEGESVDEQFIKSEVNEVNEEMHDSEIDEEDEDENEYNSKNYRNKNYDEEDEDEDEDTSNLDEEVEEGENDESKESWRKSVKKSNDSVEDDDKDNDSGIDDNDDNYDEEKYDASQQEYISYEKTDIKNRKNEEDDDEDGTQEEEEDEDEENFKKELSEEFNDEEEEEQIDKDEEDEEDEEDDDNVSADQDLGEQDDSKNLEEEEEKKKNALINDDDLGYDEIDESEEDIEDENKLKKENSKEDDDDDDDDEEKEEREDIGTISKFKKDLPSKPDVDIDETAKEIEGKREAEAEVLDDDTKQGGVAVKLGVGIALIIVAHLVLVQKWKAKGNASPDESACSDKIDEEEVEKKKVINLTSQPEEVISRRQTLVPENAFPSDKFKCEEIDDEEPEGEEGEKDEEGYSEEYSEEEEELKEPVVINHKERGQNLEKPSVKNSHSLLYADEEIEEEKEDEEEEDYGSDEVADEEEFEEDDEDVENEEVYEEEEEEEEEDYDDEEMEEKESEEETDDNFDGDTELDNSKLKKQQQQRASLTEDAPPTPPPRTHKRGPQDVDEETDKFMGHEDLSQTVPQGVGEISRNSLPPEEPKSSEKQTENDDDWYFREELSYADQNFEYNPKASLKAYDKILSKKATAVRALIGRARVLDHLAEKERSNAYLKQATNAYKVLLLEHGNLLQDDMYLKLAERCIERMRFGGYLGSAVEVHKGMILRFPNTPKYRNTLAVTYLMLNKIELARNLLNETLTLWPGNGFALVHYGFILKTNDNNMEEAVRKLTAGIQTKDEGVIDGMFFFHLGDALNRLGRPQEAMKWYDLGVKEGLFLSKYQRSLYNVNRLRGQPWWTKEETTYQNFFKRLEDNWREIQKEGLALLNSKGVNLFKEETENLKDTGRQQSNCKLAPVTCSLVSSFKPAAGCTRGQIKFSVMLPDTHVWPHCGPTNCRLRSHLGLIVPKFTYIRVAEETRSWEEGKFIIFDDSFEHEVWHNGTGPRLVLIVDVWHPELTQQERQSLSPI